MHRWTIGQILAAGLLATSGCIAFTTEDDPCSDGCSSGTCGEQGNVRFVDGSDDQLVDLGAREIRPVAVGATLAVDLALPEDSEARLEPASATLDGAFELLTTGQPILLRANDSPGEGRLEVLTVDGLEDAIDLEVRSVARGEIREHVPDMLASLAGIFNDDPINTFALLPGGALRFSVQWFDDVDEPLAGFGHREWRTPDGFVTAAAADYGDAIELRAPDDAQSGVFVLEIGDQSEDIVVRTLADSQGVRFMDIDEADIGDRIELDVGEDFAVFAELRDGDERVLVPPAEQRATLELDAGASQIVDVSDQPTLDYFVLRGVSPGTAQAQLRYGGAAMPITVEVTQP